jgi:hypothetical protein
MTTTATAVRIDLNVSYDDKDEAKASGARWDWRARTWYTTTDNPAISELVRFMREDDAKAYATDAVDPDDFEFEDELEDEGDCDCRCPLCGAPVYHTSRSWLACDACGYNSRLDGELEPFRFAKTA